MNLDRAVYCVVDGSVFGVCSATTLLNSGCSFARAANLLAGTNTCPFGCVHGLRVAMVEIDHTRIHFSIYLCLPCLTSLSWAVFTTINCIIPVITILHWFVKDIYFCHVYLKKTRTCKVVIKILSFSTPSYFSWLKTWFSWYRFDNMPCHELFLGKLFDSSFSCQPLYLWTNVVYTYEILAKCKTSLH